MLKSIEEEWNDYASVVMPTVKPESVQYDETKKAFFAGAVCVYAAFMEMMELSEEQSVDYLNNLRDDFERFRFQVMTQVMKEYGERN